MQAKVIGKSDVLIPGKVVCLSRLPVYMIGPESNHFNVDW